MFHACMLFPRHACSPALLRSYPCMHAGLRVSAMPKPTRGQIGGRPGPGWRAHDLCRPLHAGGPLLDTLADVTLPLWAKLLGLVAVNVVGFQAVEAMLRASSDRSGSLSVVKLQVWW
jgi:hypothetical protein